MGHMRFNHMELTFPRGTLTADFRKAIDAFYCDVLGWTAVDAEVPGVGDCHILLPDEGQFLLLAEADRYISSPGWDHLGLLQEGRTDVDRILDECRVFAASDGRLQLKEFEQDLVTGPVTTHAFYFRYLLPLWFDVQSLEYSHGGPANRWEYTASAPADVEVAAAII
jgi:hypothetical protein